MGRREGEASEASVSKLTDPSPINAGFAKVVIGGLSSSKVETLGLGGDGAEGVVDGGFSKKIARMLREQCEGIVGGEGGKRKGGEWGGDEGGAGRGGGGLKVWGRRGGRQ